MGIFDGLDGHTIIMSDDKQRYRSTWTALWIWARALPIFLCLAVTFLTLRLVFSRRRLDGFLKWSCRVLVRLCQIEVQIEGLENLDPSRPYIFMLNHTSALDHFVLYGRLPHIGVGLEAAENFRIPVYGWVVRAVGNFPIVRSNRAQAWKSVEQCGQAARRQGFSVFCAPEGTRSRDGLVGPLKTGGFRIALDCELDIVPLVLIGLRDVLPPGKWRIRPGRAMLKILPPIPVTDKADKPTIDSLKAAVRDAFAAGGLAFRPDETVASEAADP